MKILYIGDIMGRPGIEVVKKVLPDLIKDKNIDFVIAQGENVTEGKSISLNDMRTLQDIGVNFFSGGNHTSKLTETHSLLNDPNQPIIGPANMQDCPGEGWKITQTPKGKILVISILGETFSKLKPDITNPLTAIDKILDHTRHEQFKAIIVNFHGDYSSEKIVFGYFVDGKVTAAIGDHWHVPTADAMIFPKGTAHITDVGMCGILHSSLGIKTDVIIDRWKHGKVNKNVLETNGPLQFNAVLINVNKNNLLANDIQSINKIIN